MKHTLFLLGLIACSDDGARPPPTSNTAPDSDSGSSSRPDGSVVGDGGTDGKAPLSDAGEDAPRVEPLPPSQCASAGGFGTPVRQSPSTVLDDRMPSISGTHQTMVWTTGVGNPIVHYVDRAQDTDPWGAEQTIVVDTLEADERIPVSSDGLSAYALAQGGRSVFELGRENLGDAFSVSSAGRMANINTTLASFPVGERISDLVVSPSGLVLVYRKVGGADAGLFMSRRILASDMWPAADPYARQAELMMVGATARRPTGIAGDGLTLFYWDEVTSTEKAAFFPPGSVGPATAFRDLGSTRGANPTQDCAFIYFQAPGTGAIDLFAAPRQ